MGHSSRAARKLVLILICIELLLVVMYGTDAWVGNAPEPLHALVDLDAEANLPTWFSSFQLTLIAINFWYFAERRRATQRPSRRFLRCCAGFFLLLSIDETAMLHERVTKLIGERYVDWLPEYFESHVLSTVGCVLVLIAALVMGSSHLRGLSAASCKAMIIAVLGCLLYVAGAAILETIGYKLGLRASFQQVEIGVEEFLEMFGATFILYAILLLCHRYNGRRQRRRDRLTPTLVLAEGTETLSREELS